ncbi:hypothetical protein [Cupriavidus necator]|uniref:hypothetical protein n=1 Tax=Cupriavidus necator TaxID=106590 RepID=UPI0012D2C9DD|nr:hypothetical protein [Cupriavidus necator]
MADKPFIRTICRPFAHAWEHALRSGREFKTEHWLKRASDGVDQWHLSRIAPMKDAASNVVKWFGTDTDSEEQKQAKANAESASRASALDLALASGMKKSAGKP